MGRQYCVCVGEGGACAGERHFFNVEISVGVRGSARVARVGGGTARIPSLHAGEAFLGQSRRVFGELVRTEWVGDTGAPVVGQECCEGMYLGGEGMCEWA